MGYLVLLLLEIAFCTAAFCTAAVSETLVYVVTCTSLSTACIIYIAIIDSKKLSLYAQGHLGSIYMSIYLYIYIFI